MTADVPVFMLRAAHLEAAARVAGNFYRQFLHAPANVHAGVALRLHRGNPARDPLCLPPAGDLAVERAEI
jgi:hypothetical protein